MAVFRNIAVLLLFLSHSAWGQKEYKVLDWKGETTLNSWLVQLMHRQYDDRREAFEKAVSSAPALQAYQHSAREKFLKLLGPLPQRTPLQAQTTGLLYLDGYRIEKVVYESFPDHHVTANLYIPDGSGPFPGVLLLCGHEDEAKATASYQQAAILFVRNGFVVLVVDPVSQGERHQLTDAAGRPLTRGGTTEHTLLNEGANLLGTSLPAYELWDNVRSLDYLVSRSEVDTARIGCLGNSGGGMQTMYFAAFDPRIKVLAPASYLSSRERTLELTGPADGCAQIPGEGAAGLEFSDYLIAAAPRPLLILAGRYDFIDYEGTLAAFKEIRRAYNALGQPQKVELFTYEDGHGISRPKREAAVNWFRRWLCNDPVPVREGEDKVLSKEKLFVTNAGAVNAGYPREVTIADRSKALMDSLLPARRWFAALPRAAQQAQIRQLLAMETSTGKVQAEPAGTVVKNGYTFHKFILRSEGVPPVPVLLLLPSGVPEQVVLWLHEEGKGKVADSVALISSYLKSRYAVVLADLRGTGETADPPAHNDLKYFNREYRNAVLALHTGRPLAGQRVTDVLALLRFVDLHQDLAGIPVEMHALGMTALPALHAVTLEARSRRLYLYRSLRSFGEILDHPLERDWYSWVIPGVLQHYDLPQLVQMAGSGRVQFLQPYQLSKR